MPLNKSPDIRALKIGSGVLALLLLIVLAPWLQSLNRDRDIWFDDIENSLSMTPANEEALVQFVAAAVLHRQNTGTNLADVLKEDDLPRIVFLSLSDTKTPARVVTGSGEGIVNAIQEAISAAKEISNEEFQPQWIKLDIVQNVASPVNADLHQLIVLRGPLEGIAFDAPSGIAFLPEQLVSYSLLHKAGSIQLVDHSIQAQKLEKLSRTPNVKMYPFTTTSFFSDAQRVVRLYRGHRSFTDVSADELMAAAYSGGQYLARAVGTDGRFDYIYLPRTDQVPNQYNILRHAGTVYSMLELYENTGNTELLQAAQRALDYLLQSTLPCPARKETALCVVERGHVKLGGNALAAVALAKYLQVTDSEQHIPVIRQLGKWIQSVQDENGEFRVHKQTYPTGKVKNFVSQYYPGEAVLAMVRIYALDPHEGWLDTAEKGAQWLINIRDKNVPIDDLNHDHWLLYALNELYRHRPNPLYIKHTLRIAGAIVQSQNRQPEYPDWLGSYRQPPRSTPAATRSEGLSAAYQLIHDFGDPQEAKKIFETIQLGIAFQLQTQFRPESVFYLQDPQRALGGFHRSLTNYEIRIDYVQHNISSLLGLYRLLSVEQ